MEIQSYREDESGVSRNAFTYSVVRAFVLGCVSFPVDYDNKKRTLLKTEIDGQK